jgi:hypothetical protein
MRGEQRTRTRSCSQTIAYSNLRWGTASACSSLLSVFSHFIAAVGSCHRGGPLLSDAHASSAFCFPARQPLHRCARADSASIVCFTRAFGSLTRAVGRTPVVAGEGAIQLENGVHCSRVQGNVETEGCLGAFPLLLFSPYLSFLYCAANKNVVKKDLVASFIGPPQPFSLFLSAVPLHSYLDNGQEGRRRKALRCFQ